MSRLSIGESDSDAAELKDARSDLLKAMEDGLAELFQINEGERQFRHQTLSGGRKTYTTGRWCLKDDLWHLEDLRLERAGTILTKVWTRRTSSADGESQDAWVGHQEFSISTLDLEGGLEIVQRQLDSMGRGARYLADGTAAAAGPLPGGKTQESLLAVVFNSVASLREPLRNKLGPTAYQVRRDVVPAVQKSNRRFKAQYVEPITKIGTTMNLLSVKNIRQLETEKPNGKSLVENCTHVWKSLNGETSALEALSLKHLHVLSENAQLLDASQGERSARESLRLALLEGLSLVIFQVVQVWALDAEYGPETLVPIMIADHKAAYSDGTPEAISRFESHWAAFRKRLPEEQAKAWHRFTKTHEALMLSQHLEAGMRPSNGTFFEVIRANMDLVMADRVMNLHEADVSSIQFARELSAEKARQDIDGAKLAPLPTPTFALDAASSRIDGEKMAPLPPTTFALDAASRRADDGSGPRNLFAVEFSDLLDADRQCRNGLIALLGDDFQNQLGNEAAAEYLLQLGNEAAADYLFLLDKERQIGEAYLDLKHALVDESMDMTLSGTARRTLETFVQELDYRAYAASSLYDLGRCWLKAQGHSLELAAPMARTESPPLEQVPDESDAPLAVGEAREESLGSQTLDERLSSLEGSARSVEAAFSSLEGSARSVEAAFQAADLDDTQPKKPKKPNQPNQPNQPEITFQEVSERLKDSLQKARVLRASSNEAVAKHRTAWFNRGSSDALKSASADLKHAAEHLTRASNILKNTGRSFRTLAQEISKLKSECRQLAALTAAYEASPKSATRLSESKLRELVRSGEARVTLPSQPVVTTNDRNAMVEVLFTFTPIQAEDSRKMKVPGLVLHIHLRSGIEPENYRLARLSANDLSRRAPAASLKMARHGKQTLTADGQPVPRSSCSSEFALEMVKLAVAQSIPESVTT
jgi:hypothetical protein